MVYVESEIARLRRVVVHRPGASLATMEPRHIEPHSADYLLFDDLVHVRQAQKEHDQLRRVLETCAEVADFEDLLITAMEDEQTRDGVLRRVADLEALSGIDMLRLEELDTAPLVFALATGQLDGRELMAPLPNLLFTRDLAAVVGPLMVVGNASKRARQRESIFTWAVVDQHPWFHGAQVSENARIMRGRQPLTIEGGDVLVVSPTLALIGASERTTWSRIIGLSHELARCGFTRVLVVEMPKQRSSMHLDTVFTLADAQTCVVYPAILEHGGPEECNVVRLSAQGGELVVDDLPGNLLEALEGEGHPLTPVLCGDGDRLAARREQWTDGANFVALSPGVIVGYARNERTADALARQGFQVCTGLDYLKLFALEFAGDYDRVVDSGRKLAIVIDDMELSRGRGGPRCMTMPIERRS